VSVASDDTTSSETYDLVRGELDPAGCLVAVRVLQENLYREEAVAALDCERASQFRLAGRSFRVTASDGDSFELLDTAGRSYRRYFLERIA
jgi:hypothetical protein